MYCPNCGDSINSSSSFCQKCGAAIPPQASSPEAPSNWQARPQTDNQSKKSPALKIILFGCGTLILLGGAIAVAIYFGVNYALRSSDANKAAVELLKQSENARKTLGEITEIGAPSGNVVSELGGSGSAALSMSVTGSLASGRYFAALQRRSGQWSVISARIELPDGRSIKVEANPGSLPVNVPSSAGHQLRNDATDTSAWREVEWQQQHVRLRLPPDWIQNKVSQRELDFRAGEKYSSTYLVGNAWIWEREMPSENLLAADAQTASESFKNGVIAGYAVRDVGGVAGILTISNVGDRKTATWKSIVQTDGTQRSIDISLGAQSRDFEHLEPMFNAIFDSVRFN